MSHNLMAHLKSFSKKQKILEKQISLPENAH